MLGMALALASSLCGGCADFVGGLQTRRMPLLTVLLGSQVTALLIAASAVIVTGRAPPSSGAVLYAALSGVAIAIALGCLYAALAVGTMAIAAPIASTGAVVPVIVGLGRGEHPGVLPIAGIAAALVGVVLATRGHPSDNDTARRDGRRAIVLALLAACAFGAFFLFLESAAHTDPVWAVFVTRVSFVAAIVVTALSVRHSVNLKRSELGPLVAIGILDLAAASLFAVASRHGLLSVVSVLASFPPLVTVVLARTLIGERVRRDQAVGVALTLIGVALIATG
jgi:drug/metabolite transporter (DMT)-like permease